MKFLVRWAFRGLILLIVLLVALVLLKDTLLKALTESRIRDATGMDVRISRFEVGLLRPTLSIEDFKLYNLPEFGGSPFLVVPDLYAELDPHALLRHQLRFKLVRAAVTELNIVEASSGRSNLRLDGTVAGSAVTRILPDQDLGFGFGFGGVDTLNLTLGQIKYTNLRNPRKSTLVKVGLKNEVLRNVRSLADLTNLVMKVSIQNGVTISSGP
jgi:uncharacterized protein involved in outer membrane biogenesis